MCSTDILTHNKIVERCGWMRGVNILVSLEKLFIPFILELGNVLASIATDIIKRPIVLDA